jgi:hypothetical protein
MKTDYNAINFRNKDVDKLSGRFNNASSNGNEPGPIKSAVNTIRMNRELRKEEKARAAEQGYEYNRNIVHPDNKSPMMLKGSVAASVASGLKNKKEDIQASAAKIKSKVNQMKEASESRKAMNANANREWSGRDSFSGKGSKSSQEIIKINKKTGLYEQTGTKPQDKYKSNKKGFIAKTVDKIQRSSQVKKGLAPVKKKGFMD